MSKPNILFIFSDQHRGEALGCNGNKVIKTPNLDRIASEGVTFTQCYTNAPLCMPSRATMMTGQYVREHCMWWNAFALNPEDHPSHVRSIRDAGYHTAQIGKTHLYMHRAHDNETHSRDYAHILNAWGFEDTHELHGPKSSASHSSPYTDFLTERNLLGTHRDYMWAWNEVKDTGSFGPWELPPSPLPTDAHLDSYIGNTAAEWISNYTEDQPFYLQVGFGGPHDPFDAPAEFRDLYNPNDMSEGIMQAPEGPLPSYIASKMKNEEMKKMTVDQKKQIVLNYYAKITVIDAAICAIYQALEASGKLADTWVIYCSDHGEMAGDHRLNDKTNFYDASVRVPLIIRPPGGSTGWQSTALTDVLDIVATMMEASDAGSLPESDGRSLASKVLNGGNGQGAQEGKDVVFSEFCGYTMVFDGRYKMVVDAVTETPVELYDVQTDPDELNNRFQDPEMASVREMLANNHLSRIRDLMDVEKFKAADREREKVPSRKRTTMNSA